MSRQQQKDKSQDLHRTFNTILILAILCCAAYGAFVVHNSFNDVREDNNKASIERLEAKLEVQAVKTKFEQLTYEQHKASEIGQIVADEGYKKCIYNDSRGLQTIGFGHLILPTDDFKCITAAKAVELLVQDYAYAEQSVSTRYTWATGEARLVLINMTYQMGATGVSKFKKSLECMRDEDYVCAATELLDSRWAGQTSNRASRLAGRILAIPSS